MAVAAVWFRKAAGVGDSVSMRYLGKMDAAGIGVPKDLDQAVAWYRKAANAGDTVSADALKRLGK